MDRRRPYGNLLILEPIGKRDQRFTRDVMPRRLVLEPAKEPARRLAYTVVWVLDLEPQVRYKVAQKGGAVSVEGGG